MFECMDGARVMISTVLKKYDSFKYKNILYT